MREMQVIEVRIETEQGSPLLLLREVDGERELAIWMTTTSAAAILAALKPADEDHPSSHELMINLINLLGGEISVVHIVGQQEGVFYAELIVDGRPVPARPSDAIAIALRAGLAIKVAEGVLDAVGLTPSHGLGGEEQVEQFRQFLDSVNPDDFSS